MLDETGCDAIMIGRGLLGNPWLVQQVRDYLETGHYQKSITFAEKRIALLTHMERLIADRGEKIAILEMRTHAAWYIKGLRNATHAKQQIMGAKTRLELIQIIDHFFASLETESV
jgi:tRNA-dihydrouridine synthase